MATTRTHLSKELISGVPATAPANKELKASELAAWLDEDTNILHFKVKKSNGTVLDFQISAT